MAILGNQGVQVKLTWMLDGAFCYSTISYHCTTATEWATPGQIATAWRNKNEDNLLDCMSHNCTLYSAMFSTNSPEGIPPFPPSVHVLNLAGNIDSDTLNSYSCLRFYKIPDVSNREPIEAQLPKPGMIRVPGIPETMVNGNFVIDGGYFTTCDAFGDDLVTFTANTFEFRMHYNFVTSPSGASDGVVPVASMMFSSQLGSQVTRKLKP